MLTKRAGKYALVLTGSNMRKEADNVGNIKWIDLGECLHVHDG